MTSRGVECTFLHSLTYHPFLICSARFALKHSDFSVSIPVQSTTREKWTCHFIAILLTIHWFHAYTVDNWTTPFYTAIVISL